MIATKATRAETISTSTRSKVTTDCLGHGRRDRSALWRRRPDGYLVACLQREVAARDAHGGERRIRAARFPAPKSLEEFDYDHARGLARDLIAHLGTLDFVAARNNVVFLGPPGTGKTRQDPL